MANQADNSKDKYELIFEDEQGVSIWRYDKSKFKNGPISVENRYKASFLKDVEESKKKKSTLQLAKEAKKKKSSAEKKQEKKDKFDKKFWT